VAPRTGCKQIGSPGADNLFIDSCPLTNSKLKYVLFFISKGLHVYILPKRGLLPADYLSAGHKPQAGGSVKTLAVAGGQQKALAAAAEYRKCGHLQYNSAKHTSECKPGYLSAAHEYSHLFFHPQTLAREDCFI
jgi:hypothetical protein